MRTIKHTIIVLLATLSSFTYSQKSDTIKAKRVIITTSLYDYLLPFRLNAYTINIGSEVYLKNGKSVFLNIGLIRPNGPPGGWFDIDALSTKGIKVQIEGKHFLNKHKIFEPAILGFWPHIFQYKSQALQNTGYYVAAHSYYQFTKTYRPETIEDSTPFPNTHYSKNIYTVDRNVIGLNFVIGYQCVKKCGFTIDCATGLGLQYISSSSNNKLGSNSDYPENEKDFGKKLFDTGAAFAPNYVIQFRIGWGL